VYAGACLLIAAAAVMRLGWPDGAMVAAMFLAVVFKP
jgi:hypothetical protein